jgi:hypothetical protein
MENPSGEVAHAAILGENAGPDLLNAASDIRAVIARADDAYEPFYVKYAEQCGLAIAE